MSKELNDLLNRGMTVTCVECDRSFDLLDPAEADEWGFGHDCET